MKRTDYEFKIIPGNIAYVALNSYGSDAALQSYLRDLPQISQAKAIIFDVRKNGGGSTEVGYGILKTLTQQPFPASHSETRDYKPTYRAWGRRQSNFDFPGWNVEPDREHHYAGKVVVLTSARTFSAAEDFVVAFDTMQRGKIIGEATGGSTGQPLMISLPGGGSARICTKNDTYADGKPFIGVGVRPDIEVHTTVADFRAGRDTVLEAALNQIQ
jgi:C-terminal processing protease CtpA/Prc